MINITLKITANNAYSIQTEIKYQPFQLIHQPLGQRVEEFAEALKKEFNKPLPQTPVAPPTAFEEAVVEAKKNHSPVVEQDHIVSQPTEKAVSEVKPEE